MADKDLEQQGERRRVALVGLFPDDESEEDEHIDNNQTNGQAQINADGNADMNAGQDNLAGGQNGIADDSQFQVPDTDVHINATRTNQNRLPNQSNNPENDDTPPTISAAEVYIQLKKENDRKKAAKAAIPVPEADQDNEANEDKEAPAVAPKHAYEEIFEVPDVYQFPFDKQGLERPWLENKEKSDEYFNYGFTEDSFKEYQRKLTGYADKHMNEIMDDNDFNENVLEDGGAKYHKINFYLPHEFGGCGSAYQQNIYGLFNIYSPKMDLAIIRPRWTTKQEFKVDLPQNSQLEMQEDVGLEENEAPSLQKLPSIATLEEKHIYTKNFEKDIIEEFYKNRVPELELQLQEKRKQMQEEKDKYDVVKKIKETEFQKLEGEAKEIQDKENKERVIEIKRNREKKEREERGKYGSRDSRYGDRDRRYRDYSDDGYRDRRQDDRVQRDRRSRSRDRDQRRRDDHDKYSKDRNSRSKDQTKRSRDDKRDQPRDDRRDRERGHRDRDYYEQTKDRESDRKLREKDKSQSKSSKDPKEQSLNNSDKNKEQIREKPKSKKDETKREVKENLKPDIQRSDEKVAKRQLRDLIDEKDRNQQ